MAALFNLEKLTVSMVVVTEADSLENAKLIFSFFENFIGTSESCGCTGCGVSCDCWLGKSGIRIECGLLAILIVAIVYVTKFAKRGLIHASDFPTLTKHNIICKQAIRLKFSVVLVQ